MKTERWQQVDTLFQSTSERAPEERAAFLEEACRGDEALRRQVESLIRSYEREPDFIEAPAFAVAPELLTNEKPDALLEELIGRYRVESLIGLGGMGEVYLARDEALGRKVALKLLPKHLMAEESQLNRFKLEARAASALNHPNILTVYEIGEEGGRHFIVTEFIEGVTLRSELANGRLNLREALEIAVQVASALSAAHETGVVHRDIKPENIMLRPDGYAKVLDFGIAKLTELPAGSRYRDVDTAAALQTRTGLVLGTSRYMSPEQARGQPVDARSDIWSLGVMLYEMALGSPPFKGETPSDCIASILTAEPPVLSDESPDIPAKLSLIVAKALRKNKEERYQTIKEMLADLRDLQGEMGTTSSPQLNVGGIPSFRDQTRRRKRGVLLILSAAIVTGAAFVYQSYFVAPVPSPSAKSIAVLPFADLSPGRDQEYFCDGIQEEILTRLGKIADLKVISRTSVQKYKSSPDNLREIARQLGVANILEGSVQKSGDAVRVSVQLINAQTDAHLWAETYDRKLIDLFAVESDISKMVADTLQVRLTDPEQRAIASRPTENPEAHQSYLQGLYFFNKRTGPDLSAAIKYYEDAVAKDPSYALAYAGMADTYTILSVLGGEGPKLTVAKAKEAAQKALELDDALPEAHNSLGLILAFYEFDFERSKKEFERAIELNPNYATAHQQFGNANLCKVGEFDRAIAEGTRALELDPLSLIINADLAQNYLMARRYDEAIEQAGKTLALDSRFYYARWILGEALQMKGQLREALAEYEKTVELTDDPTALAMLAQAYAKVGQTDKARSLFAQLKQLATQRYVGPISFAFIHLALAESEKAIDAIERACREPADPDVINLKVEPLLDPLRGDPRFERLVSQVVRTTDDKSGARLPTSKSIAVLPFADLSPARDQEYFCDGIHEEIITRLAKIADLKVISRTSTRRYKSAPENLPEIARQLGVGNVLEGTVQKADGRVRVNVQLINAQNDSHLWAEQYDRHLTEVFSVESEIAKAIADTLQAKLTGSEERAIASRPTKNPEAHQLYLKGTYFSNKRRGPDLRTAIEYFRAAINQDPNYALAYAGLADAYALRTLWGGEGPQETVPLAKAAAKKALELDETLAEAHTSLGVILALYEFDFAQSRKEFERAIELNPNYATAHHQFGNLNLAMTGQFDRAIAEGKRAVELDPLSLIINADLGQDLMLARRYDQAVDQLRKTLALDPSFYYARWTLGEAFQLQGQLREAMDEYKKAAEITDDPMVTAMLAQGYAKTGQSDKARELLAQLEKLSTQRHVGPFNFALVHLALGESEKAIDDLEQAYRDRADPGIVGIKVEPLLDPLRGDPRFERLVEKVGGIIP